MCVSTSRASRSSRGPSRNSSTTLSVRQSIKEPRHTIQWIYPVGAPSHLAALLVAALPDGASAPGPGLDAWLTRLLDEAHAAHPSIHLDDDLFVERIARVWPVTEE